MPSNTSDELDSLLPSNTSLTLSNGLELEIEPLKTRELLKFLKIITHGAGSMLTHIDLSSTSSESEFLSRIMSLVVLSIPDAEEETIEFISAMTKPKGLAVGRSLNKQDTANNVAKWTELRSALDNPELEDLISILEKIVSVESSDLQALGKRLMQIVNITQKGKQSTQQEGSQESLISSVASTAGQIVGF